jgi:predicted metal-dependent enzyme (double-stranded beta helix superfamily)
MIFEDLTTLLASSGLPSPDQRTKPARERVRDVQHALATGLADSEFPLDCLERDLLAMDTRVPRSTLSPFHVMPDLGVRIALAYWGPGVAAGPHEHTDWTVTAVLHNALEVDTFDWEIARTERRLVARSRFSAERGRAGHIYDPCIHNPWNPTARWSISIHVFGPNDGPVLEREVGPIAGLTSGETSGAEVSMDDALAVALAAMDRQRVYRAQIAALAPYRSARAQRLLEAIFERGDDVTRRAAAEAIASLDGERGASLLRPLGARALTGASEIVRAWPEVPLAVDHDGARVALTLGERRGRRVLVRIDDWAEPALRALAGARRISVSDLPGGLSLPDRLALCSVLVDCGVFSVADMAQG